MRRMNCTTSLLAFLEDHAWNLREHWMQDRAQKIEQIILHQYQIKLENAVTKVEESYFEKNSRC